MKVFSFPFFKKRRIEKLQAGLLPVEKNLHRVSRGNQFLRFLIEKAITEFDFGCITGNKCRFNNHRISITERFLKGAIHIYDWDHKTQIKKIKVTYPIAFAKILAAVFKITD